jgi:hypothetical protein
VLVLVLATGGCYAYQPIRPGDAALDARVRATVSAEKAAEVAPALRGLSTQLSGTLLRSDEAGVLLDVPVHGAGTGSGMSAAALKSRVFVPFGDLVTLETRTLSKGRTAAVLGALVAGVTAGWVVVGGGDPVLDKPKTGTDNAIILRLPLRLGIW